jgi:hypothetical protein
VDGLPVIRSKSALNSSLAVFLLLLPAIDCGVTLYYCRRFTGMPLNGLISNDVVPTAARSSLETPTGANFPIEAILSYY